MQKFWKEFVNASKAKDKVWFEQNSIFPILSVTSCGEIIDTTSKEDFLNSLSVIDYSIIKKLKLNSYNTYEKSPTLYTSIYNENFDYAKHIPNGSLIINVSLEKDGCTEFYSFVNLHSKYYFFSKQNCCGE